MKKAPRQSASGPFCWNFQYLEHFRTENRYTLFLEMLDPLFTHFRTENRYTLFLEKLYSLPARCWIIMNVSNVYSASCIQR